MTLQEYKEIEAYMLSLMNDSAHDCQHVYRVWYAALDIAQTETDVDMDVLPAACLLHDIGRQRQFDDPSLCHAAEGAAMAYAYLLEKGWSEPRAAHVRAAVTSHRYRTDAKPDTIEAKILFDADKLDVTGAIGVARTLFYGGEIRQSLYFTDDRGLVRDGRGEREKPSFFREYHYKLKKLYDGFYTRRGQALAAGRREALDSYYDALLRETQTIHRDGRALLEKHFAQGL